jgi:hypothetical protein
VSLEIVLIVVAAVILLVFIGGVLARARIDREIAPRFARDVAEADRALQVARAADKGWERSAMEQAARQALTDQRPDFAFDDVYLVLVDDRPGVTEDRAHFAAVGSGGDEVRVVLSRRDEGWVADSVGREPPAAAAAVS